MKNAIKIFWSLIVLFTTTTTAVFGIASIPSLALMYPEFAALDRLTQIWIVAVIPVMGEIVGFFLLFFAVNAFKRFMRWVWGMIKWACGLLVIAIKWAWPFIVKAVRWIARFILNLLLSILLWVITAIGTLGYFAVKNLQEYFIARTERKEGKKAARKLRKEYAEFSAKVTEWFNIASAVLAFLFCVRHLLRVVPGFRAWLESYITLELGLWALNVLRPLMGRKQEVLEEGNKDEKVTPV